VGNYGANKPRFQFKNKLKSYTYSLPLQLQNKEIQRYFPQIAFTEQGTFMSPETIHNS
jgi:hypothetical protein